jgi:nondiscriminating aspartyl-tRNA synthetase
LFRGIELVTGGQRLHRFDDDANALEGQDLTAFNGYLEAFRHGMPPHGGFAIGLERWVGRLTGAANIREVTLFPRALNRLTPLTSDRTGSLGELNLGDAWVSGHVRLLRARCQLS